MFPNKFYDLQNNAQNFSSILSQALFSPLFRLKYGHCCSQIFINKKRRENTIDLCIINDKYVTLYNKLKIENLMRKKNVCEENLKEYVREIIPKEKYKQFCKKYTKAQIAKFFNQRVIQQRKGFQPLSGNKIRLLLYNQYGNKRKIVWNQFFETKILKGIENGDSYVDISEDTCFVEVKLDNQSIKKKFETDMIYKFRTLLKAIPQSQKNETLQSYVTKKRPSDRVFKFILSGKDSEIAQFLPTQELKLLQKTKNFFNQSIHLTVGGKIRRDSSRKKLMEQAQEFLSQITKTCNVIITLSQAYKSSPKSQKARKKSFTKRKIAEPEKGEAGQEIYEESFQSVPINEIPSNILLVPQPNQKNENSFFSDLIKKGTSMNFTEIAGQSNLMNYNQSNDPELQGFEMQQNFSQVFD